MMGKTHYRLGILYYLLFGLVPLFAVVPALHSKLTLAGILTAAIAALLPDLDSHHGKIHQLNPVLSVANHTLKAAETGLHKMTDLFGGVALYLTAAAPGAAVLYYHERLGSKAFILGGILIAAGILIGRGLRLLEKGAVKVLHGIKKVLFKAVYLGLGAFILVYNYQHDQSMALYIWAALFAVVAIFPHRTFLHSIEGLMLFTLAVKNAADVLGYPYLTGAFFTGYFAHLYLSDILTKEGVPLSVLPFIFKKLGLHEYLKNSKLYSAAYGMLDRRLVIPCISTGTKTGDLFESAYVIILFIITAVSFIKNGGRIGWM